MMYVDADRLKEEIEKRKPDYTKEAGVVQYQRMWAYNDVLELIDTLLKERQKTDLKKLMDEVREWTDLIVDETLPEQDGDFISEGDYRGVIRKTALHFFERGLE